MVSDFFNTIGGRLTFRDGSILGSLHVVRRAAFQRSANIGSKRHDYKRSVVGKFCRMYNSEYRNDFYRAHDNGGSGGNLQRCRRQSQLAALPFFPEGINRQRYVPDSTRSEFSNSFTAWGPFRD